MAKCDNAVLMDGLAKLAEGANSLIAFLKQQREALENEKPDMPAEAPEKEYTYEKVRAILAEKSKTGFRADVKAILTRHGVAQLSDVKDQQAEGQLQGCAGAGRPEDAPSRRRQGAQRRRGLPGQLVHQRQQHNPARRCGRRLQPDPGHQRTVFRHHRAGERHVLRIQFHRQPGHRLRTQ